MGQRQNRDMIAQGQAVTSEAVRLTLNIENSPHWCVTSQPGAVRRIVMDLLGNALKYTDEGSIDMSLQVDKSRQGETIRSVIRSWPSVTLGEI